MPPSLNIRAKPRTLTNLSFSGYANAARGVTLSKRLKDFPYS
jgi:hypothetical protein